jgi:hypothetical protein
VFGPSPARAPQNQGALGPSLSADTIAARLREIDRLMKSAMKKDVDYGIIPGCKKPSLYQPGAEKIALMFQLGMRVARVDDLSTGTPGQPDHEIRYRVFVDVVALGSETVIATGTGECSSNEEKYRWRRALTDRQGDSPEYEDTAPDMRRGKWEKEYDGWGANRKWTGKTIQVKQVRTDPTSLVNTILQMAVKRGNVSGIRRATAASSVFTDGVEDLAGVADLNAADEGHEPYAQPQANGQAPPASQPPQDVSHTDLAGEELISEPQRKRLFAILFGGCEQGDKGKVQKDGRSANLKAKMAALGVESTTAIPKGLYEQICNEAKQIAEMPF